MHGQENPPYLPGRVPSPRRTQARRRQDGNVSRCGQGLCPHRRAFWSQAEWPLEGLKGSECAPQGLRAEHLLGVPGPRPSGVPVCEPRPSPRPSDHLPTTATL